MNPTFDLDVIQSLSNIYLQPFVGILSSVGILFILLGLSIWVYTQFYIIVPDNEALVRTGGIFQTSKQVILKGRCMIIPGFHLITRISLREMSIDIVLADQLAIRTQDYLRANMRATFYVCIAQEEEDILMAAVRLSHQGKIAENNIKDAIEKRADDAIRAIAKKKRLVEVDLDKLGFAEAIIKSMEPELKKVGLTLNSIAISEVEESYIYDENNYFDAQGIRLRTEVIQRSIQKRREVELDTKIAIEQQEFIAQKQSWEMAKQKEETNLNQQKDLECLKAQKQREIQEIQDQEAVQLEKNKILQEQVLEEERIQKQLVTQQKQIVAEMQLEKSKQQLKVAQLQAAIAITEKERERLESEAEKVKAESAIITVQEIEKAERAKHLTLINAEQEAETTRIAEENAIEIDVFRHRRQADIPRQRIEDFRL